MNTSNKEEGLVRHSALLMAAQQVGNAATIGFAVVTGQMLSKEEYGVLIPLLNIVLFMGYPMDALRTAFAHFAARLDKDGRRADIKSMVRVWGGYLSGVAALVLLFFVLFQSMLMDQLHLDSPAPLYVVALAVAVTFFLPMLVGTLQGIQSFGWFVIVSQAWGIIRLPAALLLFLLIGKTAFMAISGQLIGTVCCGFLGLVALQFAFQGEKASGEKTTGVMRYAMYSFPVLVGFSVMMTFDAILARKFFIDSSDTYARASQIGRSVIFFAQPIVMALFPKVASSGTITSNNWKNLLRALALTALLISPLIGGVLIFPNIPIMVIFGKEAVTPELIAYTRWVLLAMSPLSFVFLLMNFELAQHRFRLASVTLVGALVFILGVTFFHGSIYSIPAWLGAAGLISMSVLTGGLILHSRKNGQTPSVDIIADERS